MSRSRNIKPGFFENEVLVSLPFETRILFIGLWTLADREGRLEDRPVRVKMKIFPADDVDVNAGMQALADKGFIARYEANGQALVQILAWHKHQNPHQREAASTLPPMYGYDKAQPRMEQCIEKDVISPPDSLNLIPDSLIPEESVPNGTDVGASANRCPTAKIVDLYHLTLPMLPRIEKITNARQGYIRQRWLNDLQSLDEWRNYFMDVAASDFLTGKVNGHSDKPPFRADLEWLCKPGNFAKVMEGKYHRKANGSGH